jgi:hypothetical protein
MNIRSILILLFILGYTEIQSQRVHLIPYPKELLSGQGFFSITPGTKIISSPESNQTAVVLPIGVGCELWGEHLSTTGHMQYKTFPRIAAYAEVGWSEKDNKDYKRFLHALEKIRKHWEETGIYYVRNKVVEDK